VQPKDFTRQAGVLQLFACHEVEQERETPDELKIVYGEMMRFFSVHLK
jgi:hypothetical protein